MGIGIEELKILISLSLLVVGIVSVLAPRSISAGTTLFSVGNTAASGVLFAAALTHELAESTESFRELDEDAEGGVWRGDFPWANAIAGLTFIALLAIETIVKLWVESEDVREYEVISSVDAQWTALNTPDRTYSGDTSHASLPLLLALSIHSLLAGLSVGVSSGIESVASTTIAIVSHKLFAGYSLGCSMVSARLSWRRQLYLGMVFACATPLGIVAGMIILLSKDRDGADYSVYNYELFVAVIQAVVAGTFLYVSIVEVGMKEFLVCEQNPCPLFVEREWGREETKMDQRAGVAYIETAKLMAFLVGFLAMSSLAFFI